MNLIRIELKRKEKTIQWLSQQINKSYNVTIGYVNNKKQPSLPMLFKIAKILKVKPTYLINNHYEEPVEKPTNPDADFFLPDDDLPA